MTILAQPADNQIQDTKWEQPWRTRWGEARSVTRSTSTMNRMEVKETLLRRILTINIILV